MDTETLVTHTFYVELNGVRGPVMIVAKPDGTVVSTVNEGLLAAVNKQPKTLSPPHRIQRPDGIVTMTPTEKSKSDIRLFVDTIPCWFPECESLRANYNRELAELPSDCPSCQKGALMRKYIKKMASINTTQR